ncbi:hypothetical protein [Ekhidna sp. To15]|uniref:hypothetical protein n=1 Tax=Ekhidna sp. To15 TaxID=3395267 RepID=UPI003F51BE4B
MAEKFSEQDLKRLQVEIENQLGWDNANSWHSSMFDELSTKVFEGTQVMLSVPTLKRFFGVVKHSGAPSVTTLDALSRFVGKANWREFKQTETTSKPKVLKKTRKSAYVTIGFILALVTISLIGNKRPEVVINLSEFTFSSKVLSAEYPNSVVFDFSVPQSLRVDSLKIQQYWDPTKTIDISKEQTQATGIYYFPGYFEAKLLVDGQVAKAHDLFLKSNGWLGMVEYDPIPKYFKPIVYGDSAVSFPKSIIEEVQSLEQPVESSFHFIDDLGNVSGDNFQLTTTIQNSFDDRWAVCQTVKMYFIGTDGAMIIPFSKIGCSSDNNLMLNDVYLRGKENDLSALSADFTEPVRLSIKIENMQITISIDGNEAFSQEYNATMGNLVGLRYKFLGLGEVLDYSINDQSNNPIELLAP